MFNVNQTLILSYPISTHVTHSRLEFRERFFRVRRVRDLVTNPLTVAEYLRRPMVRRSRYLISVVDLERNQYRKVYHRTTREFFRETPLRVGIFDGRELVTLLATNWGPSVRDRMALAKFLGKMSAYQLGELSIGIFSDDLEVIT